MGDGHCSGDATLDWAIRPSLFLVYVTVSLLDLHTQKLEAEGVLLTEPVALATLGRMQWSPW